MRNVRETINNAGRRLWSDLNGPAYRGTKVYYPIWDGMFNHRISSNRFQGSVYDGLRRAFPEK